MYLYANQVYILLLNIYNYCYNLISTSCVIGWILKSLYTKQ